MSEIFFLPDGTLISVDDLTRTAHEFDPAAPITLTRVNGGVVFRAVTE